MNSSKLSSLSPASHPLHPGNASFLLEVGQSKHQGHPNAGTNDKGDEEPHGPPNTRNRNAALQPQGRILLDCRSPHFVVFISNSHWLNSIFMKGPGWTSVHHQPTNRPNVSRRRIEIRGARPTQPEGSCRRQGPKPTRIHLVGWVSRPVLRCRPCHVSECPNIRPFGPAS
jgi:hypothetical protein